MLLFLFVSQQRLELPLQRFTVAAGADLMSRMKRDSQENFYILRMGQNAAAAVGSSSVSIEKRTTADSNNILLENHDLSYF